MARGSEARAAMVAAADLRLAEAGVPNPPRHADISRSDLSQPLHPDPRRAEEGADGAVAYRGAEASPKEPGANDTNRGAGTASTSGFRRVTRRASAPIRSNYRRRLVGLSRERGCSSRSQKTIDAAH